MGFGIVSSPVRQTTEKEDFFLFSRQSSAPGIGRRGQAGNGINLDGNRRGFMPDFRLRAATEPGTPSPSDSRRFPQAAAPGFQRENFPLALAERSCSLPSFTRLPGCRSWDSKGAGPVGPRRACGARLRCIWHPPGLQAGARSARARCPGPRRPGERELGRC